MNSRLVSVVIPTYSRPELLQRAVNSVVNQTHKNLEIIVIDDNAEDPDSRSRVAEILDSFHDERIRLILNQRNLGGAGSRNVGIENSRGEFIAFLDDDDEYYLQKIEKQLDCFDHTSKARLALVYCHSVELKGEDEVIRTYCYRYQGNCVYDGMKDCIAATSQWLCRKDALLDAGCFSDVPCKQDSNLIVKLLVRGYSIDYVPLVLSKYYRDAPSGISKQGHEKRIEGEEALLALCRENYHLVTKEQQEEIEYASACRLIEHYYALHMKEKCKDAGRILLRHPMRKRTIRTITRMWKNKINKETS